MEQYELKTYLGNIKTALKYFKLHRVFIRFVGSKGGKVMVAEDMKNKKLLIERAKNGLNVIINEKKVFFYEIKDKKDLIGGTRWALAYQRFQKKDGIEVMFIPHAGFPNCYDPYTGPDDPDLPKVSYSMLRSVNHDYLIELTFEEEIPIKKLNLVPGYKDWWYWKIDLEKIKSKV